MGVEPECYPARRAVSSTFANGVPALIGAVSTRNPARATASRG
jgi:hypothetical protein